MRLLKSSYLSCILTGGTLILTLFALQGPLEISYSQTATIPFDWDNFQPDTVSFQDTLSGEFLYQIKTSGGVPLFYAKDVVTSVCFDNKCRPLNLTVYWNITGRYLGFKLPDEEFLSRYDHEPFIAEDYIQLNTLLADPHLPLGNVSFEELIQPSKIHADSIDGVSGATSKDVLAYVVEGAAYTTYTLWNIVYGTTQALVRSLTEQEMTPTLLTLILKSPSSADRIWGLRKIDGAKELDQSIEETLLKIIGDEDFFAAYSAINVIQRAHLHSESLQIGLFLKYGAINHSLSKGIIDKLKEAPKISPEVISMSRNLLSGLNGVQLGHVLELYKRHTVHDLATCRSVVRLLENDNRFISGKAYNYLIDLQMDDTTIIQALKKYESKQ